MKKSGRVYFKDQETGAIRQLTDASFEYRTIEGAQPVSLTLPARAEPYQSADLFAFFDGLIPEGWLLNLTRKNWKIPANDRMALLLTTCQDCIGAAHVLGPAIADGKEVPGQLAKPVPTNVKRTSDRCLVCMLALKKDEPLYHKKCAVELFGFANPPALDIALSDLEKLAVEQVNQRLTLTGVQRKLSLSAQVDHNKTGRLTVMGLSGGFILKPPTEEYPEMPEIEHISMKLAQLHGLRMARCGLVHMASGERAYITRRFDRRSGEKIQMEDFCQLAEKPTAKKYSGSSESLGKVIDRFSGQAPDDRLTLFQTLLFSFWIGNSDMHLKNFSLWRDPESQSIRMSPGYDFLSTRLLIDKSDDQEELALPINGKKNKLTWEDFQALGESLKIPNKVRQNVRQRMLDLENESLAMIERSFLEAKTRLKLSKIIKQHSSRLK